MTITFRTEQIVTSLSANQYFATLVKEDQDFYVFQLSFNIKQSDIVNNSLSNIQVFAENSAQVSSDNTVGFAEINLYPYVASEVRAAILENNQLENVNALYTFKDSLERSESQVPVSTSAISTSDVRSLNLQLLSRYKIDPGSLLSVPQNTNQIVELLKDHYTTDALASLHTENEYFGAVKKVSFNDQINIKTLINLQKNLLSTGKVRFTVNLYKEKRIDPIATSFIDIDVNKHTKYFRTQQFDLPKISYSTGRLNVQQASQGGTVSLQKKQIDGSGGITAYDFVGSYDLSSGASIASFTPVSLGKIEVYRCSNGSSNFNSAVVSENLEVDTTGLTAIDDLEKKAIKLTLITPPLAAEQFQIEKNVYNVFGVKIGDRSIVSSFSNISDSVTLYDYQVKEQETYEYFVKYSVGGMVKDSISILHKYATNTKDIPLGASITNPIFSFENNEPQISFIITGKISQNDQDRILTALKSSDIYAEFADEIKKSREEFSSLLFLKVERVNLKTGNREFFDLQPVGATADSQGGFSVSFADSVDLRKKLSIAPLDLTTSYLYEVRAYFKNPLTLLRDYVKQGRTLAGKTYMYRPYRFLQENVLQGTLPAEDRDGNIVGYTSLIEQDDIGIVASLRTNEILPKIGLSSVDAERLDTNKARIFWSFTGSIDNYDHFVVVKEVNKNRRILAITSIAEYIDYFDKQDLGTVIYYVLPILSDYSLSTAARSNIILVDPSEL